MKKGVMFEAVVTLLLILLMFLMYMMIAGSAPGVTETWNTTIGSAPYLYTGNNGTLYAFSGNNISMIGPDGAVKWNLAVPKNWTMVNEWGLYDVQYPTNLTYYSSLLPRDLSFYGLSMFNAQPGFRSELYPAVTSDNGILYVFIRPDFYFGDNGYDGNISLGLERALGPDWNESASYVRLMAISPDGSVLWNKPLDNGTSKDMDHWLPIEDVFISASSDRLYVYHPYSVTVLDSNGTFLFRLDNISDPAAVDEHGDIYTVNAMTSPWGDMEKVPSGTLVAYYPNGTLWWQKNMSGPLQRQKMDPSVSPMFLTLPIYRNGTLYVPLKKSFVALDQTGNERWSESSKWAIDLFGVMPFDSQDDIYLTINTEPIPGSDSIFYQGMMVAPAGNSTNFTIPQYPQYNSSLVCANNGIGYSLANVYKVDVTGIIQAPTRVNDLGSMSIMASNFRTGQDLWEFTIPTTDPNIITINPSNVKYLDEMESVDFYNIYPASMRYGGFITTTANITIDFNEKHPQFQNLSKGEIGTWAISGAGTINVLPGDNAVYVSYYVYNYEYPQTLSSEASNSETDRNSHSEAVFNRSKLAYASGVVAIDNKGHLLWNKPTDSLVTTMAANNSTVYYSTKDGKLFATQSNIALGFALIAIAYLFIRFICVGAVARARSRIDKNENRNGVMQYVVANPGSTLRDISRGMQMNIGTARYHMFILSLNHRVVVYQADGKHVRYFINSGTYSKEEQMIMSFMRRDGMRKILSVLLNKPGLSNVELSSEVGLQESAVSRYMKELAEKGIVVKELAPMGTSAYFLSNDGRMHVEKAMEIMKGV